VRKVPFPKRPTYLRKFIVFREEDKPTLDGEKTLTMVEAKDEDDLIKVISPEAHEEWKRSGASEDEDLFEWYRANEGDDRCYFIVRELKPDGKLAPVILGGGVKENL
jgi:hypothetical protein